MASFLQPPSGRPRVRPPPQHAAWPEGLTKPGEPRGLEQLRHWSRCISRTSRAVPPRKGVSGAVCWSLWSRGRVTTEDNQGERRARPTGSDAAPASTDAAKDEDRERDDGQDDENGPQHCESPSG